MTDQTVGLDSVATGNLNTGSPQPEAKIEPKKTRGTTTSDPKLVACVRIAKAIDALSDGDRAFVLAYIGDRYPSN